LLIIRASVRIFAASNQHAGNSLKAILGDKRLLAAGMLLAYAGCCLSSCAAGPEPLNSERIARKFGSYGLELVENENNIRVSNLYSTESGLRICRTFAVVGLTDSVDPSFTGVHERIIRGGSIGSVFRTHGWEVGKRHLYIGEIGIGRQAKRLTDLMQIEAPATLAVHIYTLWVSRDGKSFDYAMIAEVHHPDFQTIADLWSAYGGDYSGEQNRRNAASVLTIVRQKFRPAQYSG
jgi:hypothetical protein